LIPSSVIFLKIAWLSLHQKKVPDKMVSGFMEIQSGAANLLSKPELKTKAAKNGKSG